MDGWNRWGIRISSEALDQIEGLVGSDHVPALAQLDMEGYPTNDMDEGEVLRWKADVRDEAEAIHGDSEVFDALDPDGQAMIAALAKMPHLTVEQARLAYNIPEITQEEWDALLSDDAYQPGAEVDFREDEAEKGGGAPVLKSYGEEAKRRHWKTLQTKLVEPVAKKVTEAYRQVLTSQIRASATKTAGAYPVKRWKREVSKACKPALAEAYARGRQNLLIGLRKAAKTCGSPIVTKGKIEDIVDEFGPDDELLQGIADRFGEALVTLAERMRAVRESAEGVTADDLDAAFAEYVDGWAEIAATNAATAAVQQARTDVMEEVGIEQHEWLSRRDMRVRENHAVYDHAGPRPLGFNWAKLVDEGYLIRWPYDEECEEMSEIANCRCLSVPSTEEWQGDRQALNALLGDLGEGDEAA